MPRDWARGRASKRASREKVHQRRPELTGQGRTVESDILGGAAEAQQRFHTVSKGKPQTRQDPRSRDADPPVSGRDDEGFGPPLIGCMTSQHVICYSYLSRVVATRQAS